MVNLSDEDQFAYCNKMIYCPYILLKHPRTSDTVRHSCRKPVAERTFSCMRQIDNWFRDSMQTNLLGDLTIVAVHGHIVLILKTYIRNTYMNIHPCRLIVSSLFIGIWFTRYIYISIYWDYYSDTWLFTKFNPLSVKPTKWSNTLQSRRIV